MEKFKETNALLEGHFVLIERAAQPEVFAVCIGFAASRWMLTYFGELIAERLSEPGAIATGSSTDGKNPLGSDFDTVASPAIGGLIIGYATAQAMGKRFIWTERQNGVMTVRRGFSVTEGERILVVEDVITTGGSTRECIAALESRGAKVVAAASIIDRSNGVADVGVPRISLVSLDVPSYEPDNCPLCASGIEAVKPGSRTVAAK